MYEEERQNIEDHERARREWQGSSMVCPHCKSSDCVGATGHECSDSDKFNAPAPAPARVEQASINNIHMENAQWTTWGIIEIAARNPNVASYMKEWEARAVKAEKSFAELRGWFAESIAARER